MIITPATNTDIAAMVHLSNKKRQAYAKVHPQFWQPAIDADMQQQKYFTNLLDRDDFIILVAKKQSAIVGRDYQLQQFMIPVA